MPARLQRSRRPGWRMPPGSVYVGRPTRWGNPFRIGPTLGRAEAIAAYREWIAEPAQAALRSEAAAELRGRDLVCWCPLGGPCHADVLIELANRPVS